MNNLKLLRAHRGLSITDLAEMTGISRSVIGKIDTGEQLSSVENALKIAKCLNCTLDNIFLERVSITYAKEVK